MEGVSAREEVESRGEHWRSAPLALVLHPPTHTFSNTHTSGALVLHPPTLSATPTHTPSATPTQTPPATLTHTPSATPSHTLSATPTRTLCSAAPTEKAQLSADTHKTHSAISP